MARMCLCHSLIQMISRLIPWHLLHLISHKLILRNPIPHSHLIIYHFQPLIHICCLQILLFFLLPLIFLLSPHTVDLIYFNSTILSKECNSFSCFAKSHVLPNLHPYFLHFRSIIKKISTWWPFIFTILYLCVKLCGQYTSTLYLDNLCVSLDILVAPVYPQIMQHTPVCWLLLRLFLYSP